MEEITKTNEDTYSIQPSPITISKEELKKKAQSVKEQIDALTGLTIPDLQAQLDNYLSVEPTLLDEA